MPLVGPPVGALWRVMGENVARFVGALLHGWSSGRDYLRHVVANLRRESRRPARLLDHGLAGVEQWRDLRVHCFAPMGARRMSVCSAGVDTSSWSFMPARNDRP